MTWERWNPSSRIRATTSQDTGSWALAGEAARLQTTARARATRGTGITPDLQKCVGSGGHGDRGTGEPPGDYSASGRRSAKRPLHRGQVEPAGPAGGYPSRVLSGLSDNTR